MINPLNLNPLNLSIPALIICVGISFIPSGDNHVSDSGHWESGDRYVYQTRESATYCGESDGVATFETSDGNVWECEETIMRFVVDSDLQEGDGVTLTFENSLTREEYARAEEYGIEYGTREDSGLIIAID